MVKLGEYLKKKVEETGRYQQDLAREIGVSREYISRLEEMDLPEEPQDDEPEPEESEPEDGTKKKKKKKSPRTMRVKTLAKFIEVLNLDPRELFDVGAHTNSIVTGDLTSTAILGQSSINVGAQEAVLLRQIVADKDATIATLRETLKHYETMLKLATASK